MLSATSQGAVSEYEHLNSKNCANSQLKSCESSCDDENDFFAIKAHQYKKCSSMSGNENKNFNRSKNKLNAPLSYESLPGEMFSTKLLPTPVAWSPGVSVSPSIFLTPDKYLSPGESIKANRDNILEPHDTNQQPVPVPWSPGMIVKPNPLLYITPEKSVPFFSSVIKDNFVDNSAEMKENLKSTASFQKSRGKHSVRFDLPASDKSCSFSGDPLKGSSMLQKESEINNDSYFDSTDVGSQQLINFSQHKKNYDPVAYSDESALEDSFLPYCKDTNNTEESNINNSLSDSVKERIDVCPLFGNSGLSIESNTQTSKQSLNTVPARKTIKKASSVGSSCLRKTMTNSESSTKRTSSHAGPQFLKSAQNQYDKNPPKPYIIRESKHKLEEPEYSYPFDAGQDAGSLEYEHAFARPEFNSTLRVRSELDELKETEIDLPTALKETLTKNEQKRTEMNEKASLYTNRLSNQFHNLVDLDASVEGLCDRIVRMRTSRAVGKKKTALSSKKSSQKDDAPDLMEFFSPELQKETPDLSLPGIPTITSKLVTAPQNVAFDLYRHNRLWNGINDF